MPVNIDANKKLLSILSDIKKGGEAVSNSTLALIAYLEKDPTFIYSPKGRQMFSNVLNNISRLQYLAKSTESVCTKLLDSQEN